MSNENIYQQCPTDAELVAFSDGRLTESQLGAIAAHVTTCHQCESNVESISNEDPTLVAAVVAGQQWESMFNSPVLRDLIARGQAMRLPLEAVSIDRVDVGADSERSRTTDNEEPIHPSLTKTWNAERAPTPSPRKSERLDESLPEKIGKYFVLQKLGSGGFGIVYLAKDPERNRRVAIKIPRKGNLTELQIQEFLREARTVATLEHPNIVPVYDWGRTENGGCFVVMKYIDGQSLGAAQRSEKLSHRHIAELCAQIAAALHYAHSFLVHRDIKPANILLDTEGQPHIVDFGLAIHDADQQQHKGEQAGTRLYMPPEQVRGESHLLDGRCDVWALGVTLYELLTRRYPFTGDGDQLRDEILNRPPKPPRQIDDSIPAALEKICLRCLSKSVLDRYPTALDLSHELHEWLSSTTPTVETAPSWRSRWRRSVLIAAPLMLLVVASLITLENWNPFANPRKSAVTVPAQGQPIAPEGASGKWLELLGQPLGKIAVLKGDTTDFLQQDTDKKVLTMRSERNLWVLNSNHRGRPPLQLRGSLFVDDWVGSAGFFWGLSNDPQAFPRKNPQCFAIMLERYDPGASVSLSLKQLFVDDFINDVPWINNVTTLAEVFLNEPVQQFQSLEVVLKETEVEVKIDGRVVWKPEVPDKKVFQELLSAVGPVGIAGRGKTVVFREAAVMFQDSKKKVQ